MHKPWQTFITFASGFAAVVLTVSALHADNPRDKHGSMMGNDNMMGKQMGRMGEMMEGCGRMMGDHSNKPNDQWRKQVPKTPEKKS